MSARTWTRTDVSDVLHRPTASDDKYSRGVVGIRTGSDRYPGAAVLGVEAAWRTGVGMVRYVGPERPTGLVLARRPETVTGSGRVQAWLIGSGTDAATRDPGESAALRGVLRGSDPVVVDAGALELAAGAPAPRILTPHAREHARLREALGLDTADPDSAEAAADTARATGAVVVRKGARTVIADPDGRSVAIDAPTWWLATAGTGDVLAGIIAAVTAGRRRGDLLAAAASGVWLHGRAGALAVAAHGGGPVTALDVAAQVPFAVAEALADGTSDA